MEGHENQEKSIQESEKINDRHKPALAQVDQQKLVVIRLKAKLSEARRVINLQNRT